MRLNILDGFRGVFLVFMVVVHLNEVFDVTLGKLNHHYFGWVEDAQGFVFISGLVVGLVYGRILIGRGFDLMRQAVYRRARTIYSHQAALILLFATIALLWRSGSEPGVLTHYAEAPFAFVTASLALVSGSMHLGILPMYIWFMLATPLVLRAFAKGRAAVVFAVMAGLWLFAQTGLTDVLLAQGEDVLRQLGSPIPLGIFFDVTAWQIVFFSGLFAGWLLANDRLDLSLLKTNTARRVAGVALVVTLFLGVYDRIIFDDWISADFSSAILATIDRGAFSPIYLVAFAADLYLVVWLMVAGSENSFGIVRLMATTLRQVVTWKPLVFLGQHSLHVFTWHILIAYAASIAIEKGEVSELEGSILLLAGVASLLIPASFHAWLQRRERAAHRPRSAALQQST